MNKIEVVSSMFKLFEIYPRVELLSRFLRFLVYWFEAINEPSGSTWYALNLFNGSRKKKKERIKRIAYVFDDLYLRRTFPRLPLGTGLIAGITKARRYAYRDSFFSRFWAKRCIARGCNYCKKRNRKEVKQERRRWSGVNRIENLFESFVVELRVPFNFQIIESHLFFHFPRKRLNRFLRDIVECCGIVKLLLSARN